MSISCLNVKILNHTPDPELVIATAAKLCYSSSDIESLFEKQTKEGVVNFIEKLSSIGHQSPLEHISFTFGIEGVSRSMTHQLVRHRIASYSQQSQRYVKADQFNFIIPPAILEDEDLANLFIDAMMKDQEIYNKLTHKLIYNQVIDYYLKRDYSTDQLHSVTIETFKDWNKKEYQAMEKKAIEDARYILPNAAETKIIATMNARTLLNFFNERICNRAQYEIRQCAIEMLKQVKEIAPTIFKYAGPSCVRGKCKEGSMSCGNPISIK